MLTRPRLSGACLAPIHEIMCLPTGSTTCTSKVASSTGMGLRADAIWHVLRRGCSGAGRRVRTSCSCSALERPV